MQKMELIVDQSVSVVTKNGERYTFHLSAAELAEFATSKDGRRFVGDLFNEAGLETPNPVGKILLIDQILMVALEQKAALWVEPTPEVRKFLAAVAVALGRASVTIDLANYKL
jgi:hypothetical protein